MRRSAVEALAGRRDPGLVDALVSALREGHRNFSVLSSALQLLSITGVDLTASLIDLLGHPDADLRTQAALALGMQNGPDAVGALLRALDDVGLAPGMTSGFRDDYRQSIATGKKAASASSYHGGTRRGGYGHGLAADLVSVKGDTRTEPKGFADISPAFFIKVEGHRIGQQWFGCPKIDLQIRSDLEAFYGEFGLAQGGGPGG